VLGCVKDAQKSVGFGTTLFHGDMNRKYGSEGYSGHTETTMCSNRNDMQLATPLADRLLYSDAMLAPSWSEGGDTSDSHAMTLCLVLVRG
jgi:hypothetical protein